MKKFLLSLLILMLLIPSMPITAQEPGSPEDNACNPGGAMWRATPAEGCTSEWHWVCGYYLARFYTRSYNVGGYDLSLVPDWCGSLLPPRPPVPANISVVEAPSGPLCLTNGVSIDLILTLPAFPNNAEGRAFDGGICGDGASLGITTVVAASNATSATNQCTALGFNNIDDLTPFGLPGYFECEP